MSLQLLAMMQGGVGTPAHGIEDEAGHIWVHGDHEGWEKKGYPPYQGVCILAGTTPDGLCDLAGALVSASLVSLM